MEKKLLIFILISIMAGYGFSLLLNRFAKNREINKYNTYLLQAGIYTSESNLNEYVKKLKSFVINKENGKYYVYVGMTANEDNIDKLESIFEEENINIYVKKVYINNSGFINTLKQYDVLLKELTDTKDISKINEAILDSYESLIKT